MAFRPSTLKLRPSRPSRPAALAVLAFCVLVVAGGWLWSRAAAHRQSEAALQSVVVRPRLFTTGISVAGTIAPGDQMVVTAPFDGVVKRMAFEYGAPVRQGQLLIELDAAEARQHRNEAEAAFLKADQASADMAAWNTGPDVSRARRAATSAAFDLADTRRKAEETKALLDRGLVARSEYDSLVQQQRSQQMTATAADQDLAIALRRGQGSNRQVAALELENARSRLAELDGQLAGAVVRAPAAGVLVSPPADKADSAPAIHPGLRLTKGQLIGVIAPAGRLAVVFKLAEADADRVKPGQAISLTGPGFGAYAVNGRVVSVGGEAVPPSATSGPLAAFAASARLQDLTPAQAAAIRIGMTANVTIELSRSPSAIVVPAAAIRGGGPSASVLVKDPASGRIRPAPIRLGQAAADGVEVLSGLKAGDVVLWPAPPASASGEGGTG